MIQKIFFIYWDIEKKIYMLIKRDKQKIIYEILRIFLKLKAFSKEFISINRFHISRFLDIEYSSQILMMIFEIRFRIAIAIRIK